MRLTIAVKIVTLIALLVACAEAMLVGVSFAAFRQERAALLQTAAASREVASVDEDGFAIERPAPVPAKSLRELRFRALALAAAILFISVICGFFFSEMIAAPLRDLLAGVSHVARGNYRVQLAVSGRDEIAELSQAFNSMAKGLEDRDRVKATLSKLHDKGLVDRLLSGKFRLGGELQRAAVLFVDIRGFTTLSERLPPQAVVETLNEYLTVLVDTVHANGGIVDKFLGDGLLAAWGVPVEQEDDCRRALRCCLEIRAAVATLNRKRHLRGQPELRIGMGLNAGDVIAGNIGSRERMEYTLIGDTVNTAARIEALTKDFKTDLLVSKRVHDRARGDFSFRACGSTEVRGKRIEVELFQVLS